MELVARNCGQQLSEFPGRYAFRYRTETHCSLAADYQRCVLSHRSDADGGVSACNPLRIALSACASEAVPLVSHVKHQCQAQIQAYDACLQRGQNDSDEEIAQRCTPALKNLWTCTEAVKRDVAAKEGKPTRGASDVGMGPVKE